MRLNFLSMMTGLACWLAAGTASADIPSLYGQADNVWDAQVSPSGRYVALGCSPTGWPSICVYDMQSPGEPRLLQGSEETRLLNFYWASDKHIISNSATFTSLKMLERPQEYEFRRALSFDVTTGELTMLLTNVGLYLDTTNVVSTCSAKPDKILMQLTVRLQEDAPTGSKIRAVKSGVRSQQYEVDLASGRGKALKFRNASIAGTLVDKNCDPLVNIIYNDQRGEFALETAKDNRRFFELKNAPVWPMDVIGMSDDGKSVVVRADYTDRYGLHTIRISDGAIAPIVIEGEEIGNLGVLRDEDRGTIYGFAYEDDLVSHMYSDPDLVSLQSELEDIFQKEVRIRSMSRDRSMMTISAESAGKPIEYFLYDATSSEISPLGSIAPHLPEDATSDVSPFVYKARDGLEIPAYLTLPPGKSKSDGPFPVIVMPHGGPESRDNAAFDWWPQAYAKAGYAVIQPNFRGSSGYGPAFRDAGFGEFGGKMIDDIIDAASWAESEGLSKQGGACVVGASYGGYAALMSGLNSSGQVSCVIAVSPVTDIFGHMASYQTDAAGYQYWARYVGGDKFSAPDMRRSVTPAARTSEYSVPVMIFHGKSDSVVQVSQSRNFAKAWGTRSGLTFIEMNGQDHYLRSTTARKEILSESLNFLEANHPGRR